jgi:hypothetical protein
MKLLDLGSDLVISFEIAHSGLKEGDIVAPVTVTIKNQGESVSVSTKAFFGYFPFFGSGAIFFADFKCLQCNDMDYYGKYRGPGTHGLLLEWSVASLTPGGSISFTFNPFSLKKGEKPAMWMPGKYAFVANVYQGQKEDGSENPKIVLVDVARITPKQPTIPPCTESR